MRNLFGGSKNTSSQSSQSGFGALPSDLQGIFRNIATQAGSIDPASFTPIGLTSEEQQAQQMINPMNIGQNIQNFLNPYRDIVIGDINRQFESPFGALASQASEAGAFGGSRYRQGQGDLERARLDAISNAMSNQYNTALNQMQQGIGNLLGFGGLQRNLELAQQTAPVTALESIMNILQPLLGASTSTGYSKGVTQRGVTQGMQDLFGGQSVPVPA